MSSAGRRSRAAPDAAPAAAAPAARRPRRSRGPPARPSRRDEQGQLEAELAALLAGDQVAATTVFDRDGRAALAAQAAAEARRRRPACRTTGSTSRPGRTACRSPTQLPIAARAQLVGEFDMPEPRPALRDLARLYIRFGFGAEAEALLAGFARRAGARGPGAARRPGAGGRGPAGDARRAARGRRSACPGQHGLWLALGGVAPVCRDAAELRRGAGGVRGAAARPARCWSARASPARLIDAGHPAEARVIYDTTARPGERPTPALALVGARLAAADGHPTEAAQAMARR